MGASTRKVSVLAVLWACISVASALLYLYLKHYAGYTGSWDSIFWLCAWVGCSFAAAALAQLVRSPAIFGKDRSTGRLGIANVVVFLPVLLCIWGTWFMRHGVISWLRTQFPLLGLVEETATNMSQVLPQVWLGRLQLRSDRPKNFYGIVVDLTAEFCEPRWLTAADRYICAPSLDTSTPEITQVRRLVIELVQLRAADSSIRVFVHCANGHGRSAMICTLLMVAERRAQTVADAFAQLRRVRPSVHLNPEQLDVCNQVVYELGAIR